MYTAEPSYLNKEHFGEMVFVLISEIILFSEIFGTVTEDQLWKNEAKGVVASAGHLYYVLPMTL